MSCVSADARERRARGTRRMSDGRARLGVPRAPHGPRGVGRGVTLALCYPRARPSTCALTGRSTPPPPSPCLLRATHVLRLRRPSPGLSASATTGVGAHLEPHKLLVGGSVLPCRRGRAPPRTSVAQRPPPSICGDDPAGRRREGGVGGGVERQTVPAPPRTDPG